ncbi:MAG TPA: ElyC/SanA/YdcF family protein [Anaerolineales bacterium]|nr:ElyC/SanA/YdcF family protein [Anaerolineales bacterium]
MFLRILFIIIGSGIIIILLPRLITGLYSWQRIVNLKEAPARRVAIVFGAGLWRDGSPTPVLRDRVKTAAELYFSGKIEKILMSGDNSFKNYNEPGAMREYALSLGVPDEAIVLDYAGHRTYDTCYRAREIFQIKEAILVTQKFHLPRAVYLCGTMGIDSVGVPADLREYRQRSLFFWNAREIPATIVALWEAHIAMPTPVLGDPEPIFPLEAQ